MQGSTRASAAWLSAAPATQWLVYSDPRFDFSLEYPADWTVQPRTDDPTTISEVLVFASPELNSSGAPYSISIGQYLYEINTKDTLSNWTEQYPSEFTAAEIETSIKRIKTVSQSVALYIRGRNPVSEYQFTNIRRGSVVWFVYANYGDSADSSYNEIYDHVVNSFKFGRKSPNTLQDIYGSSFGLGNLPSTLTLARQGSPKNGLAKLLPRPNDLGAPWKSPVFKNGGNLWPVTCGSPLHTQGATYAADVQASYNWDVYAANGGTVEKAGWEAGYGNLVKINSGGYRHVYGHLSSIQLGINVNTVVFVDTKIGRVGNTGGVPTHLHFHVQNGQFQSNSSGVTLVGMYVFNDNPSDNYYPSSDGVDHPNCASTGR